MYQYCVLQALPLAQRVTYSKVCGDVSLVVTPMTEPAPLRPAKYHCWRRPLSENLSRACDAFNSRQCSLRRTAELYAIPKSTLHDHAPSKVKENSSSGPEGYLSVYELQSSTLELCWSFWKVDSSVILVRF